MSLHTIGIHDWESLFDLFSSREESDMDIDQIGHDCGLDIDTRSTIGLEFVRGCYDRLLETLFSRETIHRI